MFEGIVYRQILKHIHQRDHGNVFRLLQDLGTSRDNRSVWERQARLPPCRLDEATERRGLLGQSDYSLLLVLLVYLSTTESVYGVPWFHFGTLSTDLYRVATSYMMM